MATISDGSSSSSPSSHAPNAGIPACAAGDSADCGRELSLGLLSLGTCVGLLVCVFRVYKTFRETRGQHAANLIILILAVLQTLFSSIRHLAVREERLVYFVDFFRVSQNSLVCLIYANMACHSLQRQGLFKRAVMPFFVVVWVYLVSVLVGTLVSIGSSAASCFHPSWLLMSGSDCLLVILFALASCAVMKEIRSVSDVKTLLTSFVSREQSSLEQTKRSIYVLLAVTVVSATLEFSLDAYLFSLSEEDVGDCLVLSSQDGAGTEILRVILSVLSFLCPVWAAAYVFYFIPRYQYSAKARVEEE
eukprot:g3881.t1